MKAWNTLTIADLGKVVTGKTPPSAKPEQFGDEFPFVTPSDIQFGNKYTKTERFLSERGIEAHKRIRLPKKAVCVVCIGATIGKVCATNQLSISNQQINSIIVDIERHDPDFVFYLASLLRGTLEAYAGGAATPIVNKSSFSKIKLQVPERETQRNIAAILTAYDDLIEVNKRRIALLENLAEEIYREWFVRLRFPGHQHTRFVKGVPEGWEMEPFSKLVYMNPRESINKSDFVPYVGMEDLSTTSMHFVSKEERKSASGAKFRNRDTLFPRITPCLENGKRGFVMCLKDQQIGLGSTEFIVFRERVLPAEYIYLLTCNASFRRHAELSMTGASGRQRVQHDCFDYFFIPRPPEDIRNQFVALVRPLLESVAQYSKQIAVLTKTRDLLLPRLISGKLSVEELDIQFPPSMQDQPLAPASADEARHA